MQWLLMPLSGAAEHNIESWAYWHARCMVLAWGVLMPVGALIARYFKVTASQRWPQQLDNKDWWRGHRSAQWLGAALMGVGVILVWDRAQGGRQLADAHAIAGWVLVALTCFQVGAGLARGSKGGPADTQLRGDHYDMTPHRVWFERLHKFFGWFAVLLAMAVIVLGLYTADAPRWMLLVLALWWLALAGAAAVWQRQGRCIDTYQAIWGPDARHPGNSRPPIGWGVRRRTH